MNEPPKRITDPLQRRFFQKVQFLPLIDNTARQPNAASAHQSLHSHISDYVSDPEALDIEAHNTMPMMALTDIATQKTQKHRSIPGAQVEKSDAGRNATRASFDRREMMLVGIALLLLGCTSFFLIGEKSLWLDEAYSVQLVRSWPGMWSQLLTYDHNAWLYYILLYGWARLGNNEAYVRGLSALFAIASLPVYYLLSKKLFDKKVALIAVFLLAINGFYIQYAQDARSYSLLFFLCLLSTLIFVYLLQKPSKLLYALYIFCGILAIYAHAYAVFLLAVHGLTILYCARSLWKQYALCTMLIIAGAFPILFNPGHAQNALGWVPPVHLLTLASYFFDLAAEQPILCILYGLLCAVATFWTLRIVKKGRKHPSLWTYSFVYLWLFIPLLLTFSYSLLVFPIFLARYLITGLAPFLLLVGIGISRIKHRLLFSLCLLSIAILSSLSLVGWYSGNDHQNLMLGLSSNKEDWRTAVSYVCTHAGVNDEVSFYAYYVHTSYDYYEQNSALCQSKNLQEIELVPSLTVHNGSGRLPASDRHLLKDLPTAANRIWLIISHSDIHPKNVAKLTLIQHSLTKYYALTGIQHFEGIQIQLYVRDAARPLTAQQENAPVATLPKSYVSTAQSSPLKISTVTHTAAIPDTLPYYAPTTFKSNTKVGTRFRPSIYPAKRPPHPARVRLCRRKKDSGNVGILCQA